MQQRQSAAQQEIPARHTVCEASPGAGAAAAVRYKDPSLQGRGSRFISTADAKLALVVRHFVIVLSNAHPHASLPRPRAVRSLYIGYVVMCNND